MRSILRVCALLFAAAVYATPASAEMVLYNFDAPQFRVGERTPLLTRAPNVGLADFRTTFRASSPAGSTFEIGMGVLNPLIQGPFLGQAFFPPDFLMLEFNMPVTRVEVNFAILDPGRLELRSPGGQVSQNSAFVGGPFEGGTLRFVSETPFTTLELQAFSRVGAPTLFVIDNLSLETGPGTVVPEPSSLALLVVGLVSCGGLLGFRRTRSEADPTPG